MSFSIPWHLSFEELLWFCGILIIAGKTVEEESSQAGIEQGYVVDRAPVKIMSFAFFLELCQTPMKTA